MEDIDIILVEDELVSKNADVPYVAENLTKVLGRKVLEKDVISVLVRDPSAGTNLINKLRLMAIINMYGIISHLSNRMLGAMDDLTASEIAKTYSSLMTAFNTLTTPATKELVDWDAEALKAAQEMDVPVDEVKKMLKQLVSK